MSTKCGRNKSVALILSALQRRFDTVRERIEVRPLSPQRSPEAPGIARRTGTGTSYGHEEKQETKARQIVWAPPRVPPPLIGLSDRSVTFTSLIVSGGEHKNKKTACGLFINRRVLSGRMT